MNTKVAIAYDFDGTLVKGNIQETSYIPELGIPKAKFWKKVKKMAKDKEMDEVLTYMYLLISEADKVDVKFSKKDLKNHGKSVKYFKGVESYFTNIDKYAKEHKVNLQHYIISSGTKEMIEGTSIAKHFRYIYASSFMFDQNDIPKWPALAINYTNKTQFLFRINKGIENAWDNSKINAYTPKDERPIPFERIIYIGDGLTDVPAMKLLKGKGGTSIGVYAPNSHKKSEVEKLIEHERANYVARADYSQNGQIVQIIKSIIDSIVAKQKIKKFSKKS